MQASGILETDSTQMNALCPIQSERGGGGGSEGGRREGGRERERERERARERESEKDRERAKDGRREGGIQERREFGRVGGREGGAEKGRERRERKLGTRWGVGGQRMEGRRDQGAGRQQPDRLSVGRKIYRAGLGGAVYLQ